MKGPVRRPRNPSAPVVERRRCRERRSRGRCRTGFGSGSSQCCQSGSGASAIRGESRSMTGWCYRGSCLCCIRGSVGASTAGGLSPVLSCAAPHGRNGARPSRHPRLPSRNGARGRRTETAQTGCRSLREPRQAGTRTSLRAYCGPGRRRLASHSYLAAAADDLCASLGNLRRASAAV